VAEIDLHRHPALAHEEAIGRRGPLDGAELLLLAGDAQADRSHAARRQRPAQRGDDPAEVRRPGLGVEAQHGHVPVAIEDQPRDAVALAVAEPVGGGLRVEAPVAARDRGQGERAERRRVERPPLRSDEDAHRDR